MRENPYLLRDTVLMLGFFLGSCHLLDGGAQEATYRSGVAEVRLVFSATASNPERAVPSLKATDFVVVDNESVVRNYSSFESSRVIDVQLVILLDSSESVRSRFAGGVARLQQLVEHSTWLSDQNLSIRSFADNSLAIICDRNCRNRPVVPQLSTLEPHGPTPLFDALMSTLKSLRSHASGIQPVVLLLSDGEDTISIHSFEDAVRAASSGDIRIFAIDLSRSPYSQGSSTLRRLSDATGGRYFSPGADTASIENALLENLELAYTLTYKPVRQQGTHAIRILPTHDVNLQFHCRRTYYEDGTN